jgi:hypothetical protein
MGKIILLLTLVIAGYYAYEQYFAEQTPPPPPPATAAPAAEPAPTPVDFSIKVAVSKLYDHWRLRLSGRDGQRQALGGVQTEFRRIQQVLSDRYKEHSRASLERNVAQAVTELREKYGWDPTEEPHIVKGILSLQGSQP